MILAAALWCVAALLSIGVFSIVLNRTPKIYRATYGASLAVSGIALVAGAAHLLMTGGEASNLILPIGLPWLGAHFRLDALAAFFQIGSASCRERGCQ